jgi:hypothetical protein
MSFVKITARSMTFRSSRMFPGQEYRISCSIACFESFEILVNIRWLNLRTK